MLQIIFFKSLLRYRDAAVAWVPEGVVLHAPRRQLLEVWPLRGARIFAACVGEGRLLVYQEEVFLLRPDGRLDRVRTDVEPPEDAADGEDAASDASSASARSGFSSAKESLPEISPLRCTAEKRKERAATSRLDSPIRSLTSF